MSWLDRQLYPFTARYIEFDGYRVHYFDEGAGEPVLFEHGTPSWSFEWREQVKELSQHARCIALDHLGFGLSDKPAHAAYEPEDLRSPDVGAIVDGLLSGCPPHRRVAPPRCFQ